MSAIDRRGRVAPTWPGRTLLAFRTDDVTVRFGLITTEVVAVEDWNAPLARATFERRGDHWRVRGPRWWSRCAFLAKPPLAAELTIALDQMGVVVVGDPRPAKARPSTKPTIF